MATHTYDSFSLLQQTAGNVEKMGFIRSVCFLDEHLFIGTTLGIIGRYAVSELCDPAGKRSYNSKFRANGAMSTKKSIRKIQSVYGLNRIVVLSDATAFLMDASTLECVPSSNAKVRNVADISVNDRIQTLQPFTAMQVACAHLKKPNISIYVITDNAFQLQQDLTVLPSPALMIYFSYPNACLVTKDSYYLLRCNELVAEKQLLELFPVPSSSTSTPQGKTSDQKPAITAMWDAAATSNSDHSEFLLSGPGGLGMFIAGASGDAQRPPINWAELNIQQLHYLMPYIFASTSNEIWIYSPHDQQPKQMIPFENATAFCNAHISIVSVGGGKTNRQRYRPIIASSESVLVLVPVPWQQQVNALMRDKHVVVALEAAQTYIGEENSSDDASLLRDESSDSSSFNPKVYMQKLKRVGAFILASSQLEFERAYSLLEEAEVHPLDVIRTLTPDAVPNECRKLVANALTIAGSANQQSTVDAGIGSFASSDIPSTSDNQSSSGFSSDSFGDHDFAMNSSTGSTLQHQNIEATEKVRDFVVNFALAKRSQYVISTTPSSSRYPDEAMSSKLLQTAYDSAIVNLLAALSNSHCAFDTRHFYYYLQQQQRYSKQPTERDTKTPPPSGMSSSTDSDENANKRFRRRCRQQVVNFVGDHKWHISYSCCEVLKHNNCFHAAALLHLRNNDTAAALRTWRTCAERKVDDASFVGLEQTVCAVLKDSQRVPSSEQLFSQVEWLMLLDVDAGLAVLKARADVPARDIVHFLSRFPSAQMHMLEYYVLNDDKGNNDDENETACGNEQKVSRSDDEHLHTLLAVKYIQKCVALHDAAVVAENRASETELEISKQKLRLLLKRSHALQPALLVDKLKAAGFLENELVLLYAKMDDHERAFDVLVHDLKDYAGAVNYCIEQSSTFDNNRSFANDSSANFNSGVTHGRRTHHQQRQKRRLLFNLLLSRYFGHSSSDTNSAELTREAQQLLNDANAEFDAIAVLDGKNGDADTTISASTVIPSSWPLVELRGFLLQSLRQSLHGRRMAEMQCSLERSLLLQLREDVMHKQQHLVTLNESSRCCVCCHVLSSSSFARLPGDRLAHIGCCDISRI